jgi:hypothetical protein
LVQAYKILAPLEWAMAICNMMVSHSLKQRLIDGSVALYLVYPPEVLQRHGDLGVNLIYG